MSSTFNLRLSTCAAGALLLLLSAPSVAQVSGESAAAMIERMSAEMQQITESPRVRQSPAQIARSCREGYRGMVEIDCTNRCSVFFDPNCNKGCDQWTPPQIQPGTAASWVVRRTHAENEGREDERLYHSYELVVRLAPRLDHVGSFGSVALIGSNAAGSFSIDADLQPLYRSVTSVRTGHTTRVPRPLKTGALLPLYGWSRMLKYDGRSLLPAGIKQFGRDAAIPLTLHVAYGRISQAARDENARRSNANQTILPGILGNLNQQRSIMRENPDLARQTQALVCGQAPAGQGVATDAVSLALMREQNAAMIAQMCRNVAPSDPMHSLCATSQQAMSRAATMSGADRQARINANRRPAAGQTGSVQARQAACATGEIDRLIDVWERDARMMAQDMESLGRAEVWHLRAATEDAGVNQTCWSLLRWSSQ